jgi:cell division septal protein FtsQ
MVRRKQRDYSRKSFRNPFFPSSKKARFKRFFFLVVLFLLLGALAVVVTNQLTDLTITAVTVDGSEQINRQAVVALVETQLETQRFLVLAQRNLLFFSKRQLRQTLRENYAIESVTIDKDWPDTLHITFKEKPFAVVWVSGNQHYYVDFDGDVINQVGAENSFVIEPSGAGTQVVRRDLLSQRYPNVIDESGREVVVGQPAISSDQARWINDVAISHYTMRSPAAEEITLSTQEGWQVHFNLNQSVQSQLQKLILTLQERVENRATLEYIDLRFGEKVFYK